MLRYIALLLALTCLALPAQAKRLALVIGNDSYQSVPDLRNARADARAVARALEAAGFDVTLKTDLNERAFLAALRDLRKNMQGGDDVVIYYAGHGVQISGGNYLLPTDIASDTEDQVKDESIPLQRVLEDLQEQKARFTLAIIDACRDNPFKGKGRNIGGRGLQPVNPATGQMVLYSAGAGQQALDRLSDHDRDPNGLFTRILLKEINRPGLSADRMLRSVRDQVVHLAKSANHDQVPALYDQTIGEFHFQRVAGKVAEPVSGINLVAPETSGLSLDDLKQEEKRRTDWAAWQARMQADYDKVSKLKASADLKAKAWELFLANYPQDNPYSDDDIRLRGLADTAKTKLAVDASQPEVAVAAPRAGLIAGHYRDHGDGTVTDVTTRLQWMRCAIGQTWTGSICSGVASEHTGDVAEGLRSGFAGHTDWRLPTIDELKTLVYCSSGQPVTWNTTGGICTGEYQKPTIDTDAFPNTPSSYFWSGSPLANYSNYAWYVYFDGGYADNSNRSYGRHVRHVRGGQ